MPLISSGALVRPASGDGGKIANSGVVRSESRYMTYLRYTGLKKRTRGTELEDAQCA